MSVRDDLLAKTDIVEVVGRYVNLKRTWKNRVGLCPFHKEKTPSFTVAEDKQIYKCFWCGKGGNAVNFLMEVERIDFWDACKELAQQVWFDLSIYEKHPEATTKRQQEREKLKLLNKRVQEFFSAQYAGSAAATYIDECRKLTWATVKAFGIGYAPESYYTLIEYLKSKWFTSDDMLQAGVVTKGSGEWGIHAFFRHRVTFPIVDHIGNIVWFGARALEATQNPKYLNTTETPLYEKSQLLFGLNKAKDHIRENGFLAVVEGYMDVIAMHQYGLPIGVATCGTALTIDHLKLMRRYTDQVVLLFDNDKAWLEATARALKVAYQVDVFPRAYGLPDDVKDVDELLTNSKAKLSPQELLESSEDAFVFLLTKRSSQLDLANPVYRKKFQQEMFEVVQHLQDYGVLLLQLEQLGKVLRMPATDIQREFKIWLKKQKRGLGGQKSVIKNALPDKVRLLAGLLREDTGKSLTASPDLETPREQVKKLISYLPEGILSRTLGQSVTEEEKEQLTQIQLRWEQQFHALSWDKVAISLKKFLIEQMRELRQQVFKNPHLSGEEKDELLKLTRL